MNVLRPILILLALACVSQAFDSRRRRRRRRAAGFRPSVSSSVINSRKKLGGSYSDWKDCAKQGSTCNCHGLVGYGFGSSTQFKYMSVASSIKASDDAFGGDPSKGNQKLSICKTHSCPSGETSACPNGVVYLDSEGQDRNQFDSCFCYKGNTRLTNSNSKLKIKGARTKMITFAVGAKRKLVGRKSLGSILYMFRTSSLTKLAAFGQQEQDFEWFNHHGSTQWIWMLHVVPEELMHLNFFVEATQTAQYGYKKCPDIKAETNAQKETCLNTFDNREEYRSQCCPFSKSGHSNTCEPMSWIIQKDYLQYSGCENTVAVAGEMVASSMTSMDSVGLAFTVKASSSTQTNPWRQYDLGDVRDVKRVVVTGPTDDCLSRMFKGTGCDGISAISGYRAGASEGLIVGVSHQSCSGTKCANSFVCGKAILANEDSSYTFNCEGRTGRYVYIMLPGSSRRLDSTVVARVEAAKLPEIRDVNLVVNGDFEDTEMEGINEDFTSTNPNGWTRTKGTLQVRDIPNGIRIKDVIGNCLGVTNDLKLRRLTCNSPNTIWVEFNDGYKNIGTQKCLAVRGNTNVKVENCATNNYQKIELFDDQVKSEWNNKCFNSASFMANMLISMASCATKTVTNKFTVQQVYQAYAYEGDKILDLKAGSVQQTIATMPGYKYSIFFAYSRNPCVSKAQMKVHVNKPTSQNLGTFNHQTSGHAWQTDKFYWYARRLSFTAESESTTVRFEANGMAANTCGGMYLDDIQVRMDKIAAPSVSAVSQGNPVTTFGKDKAINGNGNPVREDKACWRSNKHNAPWYSLDLGKNTLVKKLRIWRNRVQPDAELKNFNVLVDGKTCAENVAEEVGDKDYIDIDCLAFGKVVKILKLSTGSNQRMGFCEIQVFPGKSYSCNTQLCRTCVAPEAATQNDQCETCHAGRTAFNGKCIITPEWCADEDETCECRGKIHFGMKMNGNVRMTFTKMKTLATKVKTSTSSKKCSTSALGDPFATSLSSKLSKIGIVKIPKVAKQCYCEEQCTLKYFGAAKADIQAEGNHGACQKGGHFSSNGGWCSRKKSPMDWIQIDLGEITTVTGVRTRGRADASHWVKSYDLSTSSDGKNFYAVGRFNGNADKNTAVEQFFEPRDARYVRFQPLTFQGWPAMRIDALLCGNARRQLRVERHFNRRKLEEVDTSWMISHKTADSCTGGYSLCTATQMDTLRDAYGDDQDCFLGEFAGGSENFGKDCTSTAVEGKHCCKDYSGGSIMTAASSVQGAINTFAKNSLKAGTLLGSLGVLTEVTENVGGFLDTTKDMMTTLNLVLTAVSKLPYIGPVATVMQNALTPFRSAFNTIAGTIALGATKIAETFDRIMAPAATALAALDSVFATLLQISQTGVEMFTWSKACAERSGLDIPVPENVLTTFHSVTTTAANGVNSILSGIPDVSPITDKLQKFMKMFDGLSKVGEAFEFLMDIPIVLPWVDIDECAAALGRRTLANGNIEENVVNLDEKYDEFILKKDLSETANRRLLSLNETGEIGLYDDEDGRRRLFLNKLGSAIKSGWNEVVDFVKDPIGTLADVVDKGVKFVKEAKKAAMKIVKEVGGDIAKDLGVAGVLNKIGKEFSKFKKLGNLDIKAGFNKLIEKAGKTFKNIAKKLASVVSGMFACLPFPKLVTVREVMETIQRILDLPVVSTIMNALEIAMNAIISELGLDKLLVIPGLPDVQMDFAEEWVDDIKEKLSGVKDEIKGFTETMLKAVPDVCYPLPPTIAESFESVKSQFALPETELTARRQLEEDYGKKCVLLLGSNPREAMKFKMEHATMMAMAGQILFEDDIDDPNVQRRHRRNNQADSDLMSQIDIGLGLKVKAKYKVSNQGNKKKVHFCIFAAILEDKCMAVKEQSSEEVTILENVYDGTKFEKTKCYRRTGAGAVKKADCYAAYAGLHDDWTVDKTVNMYLMEKKKCANDCKKCTNGDFGVPVKTVRYVAKPKKKDSGIVEFSHQIFSGAAGTFEAQKFETFPFGCYRENPNFAWMDQGEKEWDMYECLTRIKDDYERKYEVFFADYWTDDLSNTGGKWNGRRCVQPGAGMEKSQKSQLWNICSDRTETTSSRLKHISGTGTIVGNKDTSMDFTAEGLGYPLLFQYGDELCFVPTSYTCDQTPTVPENKKFCIDDLRGELFITVHPKVDSDIQHFWFCYKHYLRGWKKQTGVTSDRYGNSIPSLEVVKSDATINCLPKTQANRRALVADRTGGRLLSEARRQLETKDGYTVYNCPQNEMRFNVVIRGLNMKKIDFRVKDPNNRVGIIRTTFNGQHGWAYFPGDDQLLAFDAGTAKSFWNHPFAKGNYEFWVNYATSDSSLNCYFDGVDNTAATNIVRKSIMSTEDFTLTVFCDAAKIISEFSVYESLGWKMVHVLEQPPTELTIKGGFRAGAEMRFVPQDNPCTYGNFENENVDRQTFPLTTDYEVTVNVQLQANIYYEICEREYQGEWVKQTFIRNAKTNKGKRVWIHRTDEKNCPTGFTKDESGQCLRDQNVRRNLANATGPGGNSQDQLNKQN